MSLKIMSRRLSLWGGSSHHYRPKLMTYCFFQVVRMGILTDSVDDTSQEDLDCSRTLHQYRCVASINPIVHIFLRLRSTHVLINPVDFWFFLLWLWIYVQSTVHAYTIADPTLHSPLKKQRSKIRATTETIWVVGHSIVLSSPLRFGSGMESTKIESLSLLPSQQVQHWSRRATVIGRRTMLNKVMQFSSSIESEDYY
jgi:hypothetical protein